MNYKTNAIEQNGKIYHVTIGRGEQATRAGIHHTVLEHKTLLDAGTFDIHLLTPARVRVHFNYSIQASKALQVEVYEGSVVTGTSQLSRSRNHIKDNVKDPIIITLDGTVTTAGVLIADVTLGSAGGTPHDGVGGADTSEEFMHPENFALRFHCTSLEANNNVIVRMNFIIEPMLEGE